MYSIAALPTSVSYPNPFRLIRVGVLATVCLLGSGVAGQSVPEPEETNVSNPLPGTFESYAKEIHLRAHLPQDMYGHRPSGVSSSHPLTRTQGVSDVFGDSTWQSLGPPGGDVFDAAASPTDSSIVLAGIAPNGSSGGLLYRSDDSGDTWTPISTLPSVFDIEFAPDGTVHIGTVDGVWTSVDDGTTWDALEMDIGTNNQVFDLFINPTDPFVLWATIGDAFGQQSINVVRSTDGGETWTNQTPPLSEPMSGQGVAVDPVDADTVIAVFGGAFGGGQVWVSTDGGESWTDRSSGLPNNPMQAVVYDGTRLLVGGGQLFNSQDIGLYESTDLGETWTALHDQSWPVLVVHDIAVDPDDNQTIFVATDGAGVHRTTDGGDSWEIGIGGTGSLASRSLRFRPGSSEELFLGTSSLAVFRSTDGGATFTQSSEGISELDLWSIHSNPLDPDQIAVAFQGQNNGGVISSSDGGDTWSVEPVPPTRYSTVEFASDGTLYAISTGPTTVAEEGLYRRESDGNWSALGPDQGPLFESELETLRFSLNDPELFLLGGSDFGVAGSEATIWRTLDDGETWSKVYEGENDNESVTDLDIVEDGTDEHMLAPFTQIGGEQSGGVLRSEDGGTEWSSSSSGLPDGFFRGPSLCASSGTPETFYLSAWLSFGSTGLFSSNDGGASWESTGWTGESTSGDLACDPTDDQILYLTLNLDGSQVVRSEDGGETFQPFADGLARATNPRSLAFAGANRLLLASGKGSYAANIGTVATERSPQTASLSNAFPNPTKTTTALTLRLDEAQRLTARVYDTLGRLVTTIHNGPAPAEEPVRLELDASSLSAGSYTIRIEGETFVETRRVAVVR